MEAFINGLNAISPQDTFSESVLLSNAKGYSEVRFLKFIEPKYSDFIDPMASRRMSRIVKTGLTSALKCLNSSGISNPGAIITGTGMGCLEDTTKFLTALYENEEKLLNPTPFIQSTHNTVSATIAQALKCNNYNSTYCDSGFSFSNALLDGMMLINENSADNILVGGLDELTPTLFKVTDRLGFWKRKPINSLDLLSDKSNGTIAGEGASFFLLGSKKNGNTYCRIDSVNVFYNPGDDKDVEMFLKNLIDSPLLNMRKVDLVIMGYNGDPRHDEIYNKLRKSVFDGINAAYYKHFCGEYQTSDSFALWLAAQILKEQTLPEIMKLGNYQNRNIKSILLFNHYRNNGYSAILLSVC